jgi:hypothetical protein
MAASNEITVILRRFPEGSIPGAFGKTALARDSLFPNEYCLFILRETTVPTYLTKPWILLLYLQNCETTDM